MMVDLFRIAEQALINVERHASAQQVTVRLAFGNDRIDLVIQDDGVGFDPAAVGPDRNTRAGSDDRGDAKGAQSSRRRGQDLVFAEEVTQNGPSGRSKTTPAFAFRTGHRTGG